MQLHGLTIFPGEHKNSKLTLSFVLCSSQHMFSYLTHINIQFHPAALFLHLVESRQRNIIAQICFAITVFIGSV